MSKTPIAQTVRQFLHFKMSMDSINTDETLINFNASTKTGYSMMEDAQYRLGTGKVSLSSISSDNVLLGINQLPLSKGLVIPLKVSAAANGNYTLSLKASGGIPQLYAIWLKDAFTKDSVDLRATTSYSFAINKTDSTSFGSKRFIVVISEDPAMAYKLLTFTADEVGNSKHVQLNWTTKNEQNYTHFTVERSNDNGNTFEVAGGMLSSGEGAYSLVDKNAQNGDNLYRLKQEDINNTITYSNVVDVVIRAGKDHKSNLACYPNPAINTLNVIIPIKSQDKSTYDLKISNSAGIVVKYVVLTDPNWQGNISHFLTGTYLVQVIDKKDNSIVGQTKFVKL